MTPEILNLIKLIPDGLSVVAVIVVVVLFLKQQDKSNEVLSTLMDKFNSQNAKDRDSYQEQIGRLAHQATDNQKAYQEQIQQMLQSHFKVSKEQIEALKTLESTMSTFKQQFTSYIEKQ